jgi:hypothetical protein
MEPPPDLKLVSSKSTPAFDQSATSTPRRPRGMSVTALRMSMKQKHDDQRSTNSTLVKELANSKTVNRVSSRSSIRSTDQSSTNDKVTDTNQFYFFFKITKPFLLTLVARSRRMVPEATKFLG